MATLDTSVPSSSSDELLSSVHVDSEIPREFTEMTPTPADYNTNEWIRSVVRSVCKRYGRSSPKLVKVNNGLVGPPNRCIYNAHDLASRVPGATIVRCFKLYIVPARFYPLEGCRAIMHLVVSTPDGSIIDPSYEQDDEEVMIIRANWFPAITHNNLMEQGSLLSAFCAGNSMYLKLQEVLCGIGEDINSIEITHGIAYKTTPPVKTMKEYREIYKLSRKHARFWFSAIVNGTDGLLQM